MGERESEGANGRKGKVGKQGGESVTAAQRRRAAEERERLICSSLICLGSLPLSPWPRFSVCLIFTSNRGADTHSQTHTGLHTSPCGGH